jgi:hypothetical protein
MLYRLFVIICFLSAANAVAQGNKITEKRTDASIDYMHTGAPMPALLMITAVDTGAARQKEGRKKDQERDKVLRKPLISNADLDNGASLFVMMFNPTCSHCEDATRMLVKNISLFKKSKIVLLAAGPMKPYLPNFIRSFHVDEYPEIYVGTDSTNFISNVFLYSALPQINIYSGDRKLVKTFTGEVVIDSLKKYAE